MDLVIGLVVTGALQVFWASGLSRELVLSMTEVCMLSLALLDTEMAEGIKDT